MQKTTKGFSLAFFDQNAQLAQVNQNIAFILEHLKISKLKTFRRSSEELVYDGQLEAWF